MNQFVEILPADGAKLCVGDAAKKSGKLFADGAKQMWGLSNVSSASAASETPTSYCCACSTCASKISVERKR